jgi:hypothetical protein
MSRDIKKQCPYCPKKKINLENHIRMAHPDKVSPPDVLASGEVPVVPALAPAPALANIKKLSSIKWKMFIPGVILAAVGVFGIILYGSTLNMLMGGVAIGGLVPGAFLIYYAVNRKESGYVFNPNKYTGKENSIVIKATWNPETKKAIPFDIDFKTIDPPLPGAKLHLLRNINRHVYEYINVVGEGIDGEKLIPFLLPDKKLCTPEAFCIPANMPRTREYMEYNPPTNFQKIASGVLILVMVIIGILMVMTGPQPDKTKTASDILLLLAVII